MLVPFTKFHQYLQSFVCDTLNHQPGQGVKQASACCTACPTQGFPPLIGGGLSHRRLLLTVAPPTPQVLGQEVQSDQGLQLPSRGPAEKRENNAFLGLIKRGKRCLIICFMSQKRKHYKSREKENKKLYEQS